MIPLHKQIQKYEDKLSKIKEREEKRAEAAKKNAGKADRKKQPIDRELSAMKTKASTGEQRDDVLALLRLAVERASSEAQYAERRYMAVDPDNRLIARTLEADREKALRKLEIAKAELALCEQQRPRTPRDGDQS
jgi:hypothetical protein